MRGVPAAPARDLFGRVLLDRHVEQSRRAVHDLLQLRHWYGSRRSTRPNRPRNGALTSPCRVVAPMAVNARHRQRMRARARTGPHQDVHPEILQRRVEHLLHVRHQPVNLVDEENLLHADVAQDPGQVELLLQHRPGGGREMHLQLFRDDRCQGRLAQPGRPVEQHVVHGLPAHARCFDRDRQVLLQLGLTGEVGQAARPKSGFELQLLGLATPETSCRPHVLPDYRTSSSARRNSGSKSGCRRRWPWPCAPPLRPAGGRSPG